MSKKLRNALGEIDESLIYEAATADRAVHSPLKTAGKIALPLASAAAVAGIFFLTKQAIPTTSEPISSGVALVESTPSASDELYPLSEVIGTQNPAQSQYKRVPALWDVDEERYAVAGVTMKRRDIMDIYFGSNFPQIVYANENCVVFTDGVDASLFIYDTAEGIEKNDRLIACIDLEATVECFSESLETVVTYPNLGYLGGGQTNGLSVIAAEKDRKIALFLSAASYNTLPEDQAHDFYRIAAAEDGSIYFQRQDDFEGWEIVGATLMGEERLTESGDTVSCNIGGEWNFSNFTITKNGTDYRPFELEIPDFTGGERSEICSWAFEHGLDDNVRYEYSEDIEEFLVIRTEPAAGELLNGDSITIVLSGREPEYNEDGLLIMPDFTGVESAKAADWLGSFGVFNLTEAGVITEAGAAPVEGIGENCVIKTEPPAGEPIDPNVICVLHDYASISELHIESPEIGGTIDKVRAQAAEKGFYAMIVISDTGGENTGEGTMYRCSGYENLYICCFRPNGKTADFVYPLRIEQNYLQVLTRAPYASYTHKGIDLQAKSAEDILAAKSGTVTRAEHYYEYGWCVEIDHGNGLSTLYGHCSELFVSEGDYVEGGEVIAKTGNSGYASDNTLHFEVLQNGEAVNPLDYIYKDIECLENSNSDSDIAVNNDRVKERANDRITEIIAAAECSLPDTKEDMVFPSYMGYSDDLNTNITVQFGYDEWLGGTHYGIDIAHPEIWGERVHAALSGEVIAVNVYDPTRTDDPANMVYGSYVVIAHGNGLATVYANCSGLGDTKVGDKVSAGDTIAYAGKTGYATGAHLHFEVRQNGEAVNPMEFIYTQPDENQ